MKLEWVRWAVSAPCFPTGGDCMGIIENNFGSRGLKGSLLPDIIKKKVLSPDLRNSSSLAFRFSRLDNLKLSKP